VAESLYAEIAEALGSRSEAQWILERASDETEARSFCARRCSGEPLQYVLGTWSFRTLELEVKPEALIPRPETEQLVEVAIRRLATEGPLRCVDLGCGTGAIGLSLAKELGARAEVFCTDVSPGALELARRNALSLGLEVFFAEGSWFDALDADLRGSFDLVISNPPYVARRFAETLAPELSFEPELALFGEDSPAGVPGFASVAHLIEEAPHWLAPGGWLALEMSEIQVSFAIGHALRMGFVGVEGFVDLAGCPRGIVGRKP
jgi:release factor glutamine methyltransferase